MMNKEKPKCRLPDIFITSNLIGKTALTLRKARQDEELKQFLNEIKEMKSAIDSYNVLHAAENYVDFYD